MSRNRDATEQAGLSAWLRNNGARDLEAPRWRVRLALPPVGTTDVSPPANLYSCSLKTELEGLEKLLRA